MASPKRPPVEVEASKSSNLIESATKLRLRPSLYGNCTTDCHFSHRDRHCYPLVYAAIGETITEKAGVINLSAEGTIMLSAMVAFAIAQTTNNLFLGFAGAAAMGALIALIVAFSTITLKQSQIAIGFVLALLCSDLSTFLGNPFVRIPSTPYRVGEFPYCKISPFSAASVSQRPLGVFQFCVNFLELVLFLSHPQQLYFYGRLANNPPPLLLGVPM
uniref:ABC transporter permease subunit n=1 Tax=Desertifilum tharense IPPAS B-1220 TaxID=1781255 RepID=A0ACD5H2I7_9CYAN